MKSKLNAIIQSFWHGHRLSAMERLCIESYLQNGHEFHLYTYNRLSNVPEKVILKDANEIIPAKMLFVDSRNCIASFSDWFRYKLIYLKGGIWVDLDMVCLKPIDFKEEFCFSSEHSGEGQVVNIGFFKSPAQADFLQDLLEHIELSDFEKVVWGCFGPKLFKSILEQYDSEKFIKPPEVFCPISWNETYKLISFQDVQFSDKVYCIHMWNEIWRLGFLDKNAEYHPESIYEKLKKKYQVLNRKPA